MSISVQAINLSFSYFAPFSHSGIGWCYCQNPESDFGLLLWNRSPGSRSSYSPRLPVLDRQWLACGFRPDYSRGAAEVSNSLPLIRNRPNLYYPFTKPITSFPSYQQKKSPNTKRISVRGCRFFILDWFSLTFLHEGQDKFIILWAGLLAPGSSYSPHLPVFTDSGILQLSFPVTAAGPRRVYTVLPF